MTKSYSLDVAFSSATQALQSEHPVLSMGFGFSQVQENGIWKGDGQAVEIVQPGSQFYFTAFDTAPGNAQKVESMEVRFHSDDTPFEDVPNPIIAGSTEIASQRGQSAGCNVVGVYSLIGPYTVADIDVESKTYRCTVKVKGKDGLVYSVDPEIIVDGGNLTE